MEKPIIYQLLPRLYTNYTENCRRNGSIEENGCGKLNQITDELLADIKDLGTTHVWYTGVIEHAQFTDYTQFGIDRDNPYVVKGKAGSPYAIKDYYDIDPDLAENVERRVEEFEQLIARTHKAGMKVIMDFVPNHLARHYHSDAAPAGTADFGSADDTSYFFRRDNNFYYITGQQLQPAFSVDFQHDPYVEFPAKATGNDCFNAYPGQNDWYETVKLNYGVDYGDGSRHMDPIPDTWHKMLAILRYWASKGVDGFRCDMAFMVPIEFWQWAISSLKSEFPGLIMIAEIYDVGLYRDFIHRGRFDYLYDKVTLYDTLRAIECCDASAASLTNCWQTVDDIRGNMLNFLENHDEQRFASKFYAGDAHRALPSLVVSATISTCPMMIYAGQEVGEKGADSEGFSGEDGRTTIFDYWSVPALRQWLNGGHPGAGDVDEPTRRLRATYRKVLTLAGSEPAFTDGQFFDLMYVNYASEGLNPHRQYFYLRHLGDETILVGVNFGDSDAKEIKVNLPQHAFDFLGIAEADDYTAIELLSEEKRNNLTLRATTPFIVDIPAKGAVMWKLTRSEKKQAGRKKRATKSGKNAEKH